MAPQRRNREGRKDIEKEGERVDGVVWPEKLQTESREVVGVNREESETE